MNDLRVETAILLIGALAAVMFLALRASRRTLQSEAGALDAWSSAYACFALASMLVFLRGTLPPVLSTTLALTVLSLGMLLLYRGFLRFLGGELSPRLVWAGAAGLLLAYATLTHWTPNALLRAVLMSALGIVSSAAILLLYWRRGPATWLIGERLTLLAILSAFVAYALRLALAFAGNGRAVTTALPEGAGFLVYVVCLNVAQILLATGLLVLTQERIASKLRDLVARDTLTGALSRRVILEMLETARASVTRNDDRWAVIMLDMDHFKAINDRHGHAVGDQVLQQVVTTIRENLRLDSHLGRLGGEEFLVVARLRSSGEGREIAERIRAAAEASLLPTDAGAMRCTVSAGVAELDREALRAGTDPLVAADAALYEAKRAGRNRVREAGSDLATPATGEGAAVG